MSSRKLHVQMFASLVLAALAMVGMQRTVSAHVYPVGVNIAPLGTPLISNGFSNGAQNDQSGASQPDSTFNANGREWTAVTYTQLKSFNELIIEQYPGFVVAGYEVQVAKAGLTNPDPDDDSKWETIPGGSFSGQTNNPPTSTQSPSTRQFALGTTYNRAGVRVRTTDASNIPDTHQRTREMWIFNNYSDLAKTASISAPGWTGTSGMNNEKTTDQEYTGGINNPANQDITLTWATPQDIGAVMVHGGAGAPSEHLIDFSIQYWDGVAWQNFVAPYVGNTLKTVYALPSDPVFSTQIRLHITAADNGDGFARVGEIFVFEALPEPSSALVMVAGSLFVASKRTRARSH